MFYVSTLHEDGAYVHLVTRVGPLIDQPVLPGDTCVADHIIYPTAFCRNSEV